MGWGNGIVGGQRALLIPCTYCELERANTVLSKDMEQDEGSICDPLKYIHINDELS